MDVRKIGIVILSLLTIAAALDSFQIWRLQNQADAGADVIKMYFMYQKAYKDSFGSYVDKSKTLRDCCMSFDTKYEIYFSSDEIPVLEKKKISSQDFPFLSKNSFRLLLVMETADAQKKIMWTVDQVGIPRQVLEQDI